MAVIEEDIKVTKFLDLISFSEGSSTHKLTKNDGYDVLVTGLNGPAIFTDFSKHPFEDGGSVKWHENPDKFSTAAGRYQLLARYWKIYKVKLDLENYLPISQDIVAIQQIKERKAYHLILNNQIEEGIISCSNIWASFPGNSYGQGGKSLQVLLDKYSIL